MNLLNKGTDEMLKYKFKYMCTECGYAETKIDTHGKDGRGCPKCNIAMVWQKEFMEKQIPPGLNFFQDIEIP